MYQQSVKEPERFWSVQAKKCLEWDQKFTKVNDCNKQEGIVRWFTGGKLNVSSEHIHVLNVINPLMYCNHCLTENCLDRHVAKYPHRTALIWERNEIKHETMSYRLSSLQPTRICACMHDEESMCIEK